MPAPTFGKLAIHFSRVAASNAAAGIRSALHAGNTAAASAGLGSGASAAAAAAGGASFGLGAAAASASGASAGASAAGGKTWGAYTYYQNIGQRCLTNLVPGQSDNGATRTEDDDDEQPQPQHASPAKSIRGLSRLQLALAGSTAGFHTSATARTLEQPHSSSNDSNMSVIDLPELSVSKSTKPTQRRHSMSSIGSVSASDLDTSSQQGGVRRPTRRMRPIEGDPAMTAAYLQRKLRALANGKVKDDSSVPYTSGVPDPAELRQPPAALVKSTVRRFLTEVPLREQSVSGWNACLEALLAARCYVSGPDTPSISTASSEFASSFSSDAGFEPHTASKALAVIDLYIFMVQAGFAPTGRTYSAVIQALVYQELRIRHAAGKAITASNSTHDEAVEDGTASELGDEPDGEEAEVASVSEQSEQVDLGAQALDLLRTAVSQHPQKTTHPITPVPYVVLLKLFGGNAQPERVEEVIQLWKHSAEVARYFRFDVEAYSYLINAQIRAAKSVLKEESSEIGPGLSLPVQQQETRAVALDGVFQILEQFEADVDQQMTDNETRSASRIDQQLHDSVTTVYAKAIQSAFHLNFADRALEIFERLLKWNQTSAEASADPKRHVAQDRTINALIRGFLASKEPLAALSWMNKLEELNASYGAPKTHQATESTRGWLLSNLFLEYKTKSLTANETELKPVWDGINTLVQSFDNSGTDKLTRKTYGFLTSARKMTQMAGEDARAKKILEEQPWRETKAPLSPILKTSDALFVSPEAPTNANTGMPTPPVSPEPVEVSQEAASVEQTPVPTESAVETVSEAPSTQAAASTVSASDSNPYGLPPVNVVDIDLAKEINAIIKPQRQNGRVFVDAERAVTTVFDNVKMGTYPAPESLGLLMMALGRQGNLQRVREIYAIATVAVAALSGNPRWQADAWRRVEDNSLCALAHAGETDAALETRHRIIAAGRTLSADAYAALIATIKDTTDDALIAEELFDESQRMGVRANVYLYTTVISKLSRARRAQRALQLFEEMRGKSIRPTSVTYGAVMNACARSGDREGALKYFAEMEADPSFVPRVPPYNLMCQFFTYTVPDRAQALRFFDKMVAKRISPSSHTYKLLLDVHGTIEPVQPEEMEAVFKQLQAENHIKVLGTHWASLIHCYGIQLKDIDRAIAIFDQSSQAGEPDSIAFEALLSVFFEAERPDLIRKYVQSLAGSDLRATAYVCNILIKGLALEGQAGLEEARAIFEQMQDPPAGLAATGNHAARSHGAGVVAQVEPTPVPQSESGTFGDVASGAYAKISKEPSTYESMIRAELSHGNVDKAEALFSRMESRAFPPALIIRTRGLLEFAPDRVLKAKLVGSQGAGGAGASDSQSTA
ncbi:hypothetical protein OC846_003160 [Tilletia horrida]|uniref:Pentacotripeptide-repeat region of PRORP domain-containing protein n=1 Tax=Tilletia horrida TaxID=155126 RepID=A0AAN6GSZ9_9BASI|nr:hypothetical protein OC845_004177 [Tilletia horrida]KAK0551775.1 hypothetical protein OC846_003160 [Tilletia horrida]KAK0561640.1 hypothetical protein OC861_005723 [Tilletia horrida]